MFNSGWFSKSKTEIRVNSKVYVKDSVHQNQVLDEVMSSSKYKRIDFVDSSEEIDSFRDVDISKEIQELDLMLPSSKSLTNIEWVEPDEDWYMSSSKTIIIPDQNLIQSWDPVNPIKPKKK